MKIHTPQEIEALPLMQFKALEALIRRTLLRRGYALSRSRARDRRSINYGKYPHHQHVERRGRRRRLYAALEGRAVD